MGQLSAKLRGAADGYTLFFCPGCEDAHAIRVGTGPGPRWAWNGNADAPTFTPSILGTWEEWVGEGMPKRKHVCHSFITDGRIQFLGDCTHALAGQTVELPDLPPYMQDDPPG